MSGRQRLLAVIRGEVPDRVPFAINIGQWFEAHKAWGRLPRELADCPDEVDAMKKMGCDIFSRRCGSFVREIYGLGIEVKHEKTEMHATRCRIETPHAALTGVSVFSPEAHTTYEREHLWKDFESDYPAVRYLMENTDYHFDSPAYRSADARVGDDGLVIAAAQQAPLKRIINLAGAENALLWACDGDPRLIELMEIHTEKCLNFARQVAASEAFGMMSMDNLDCLFYTPQFFDRFCRNYYRRIGEVLHARGKFWASHACGRVNALRSRVAEVELDGLEGTPHAPLGDIDLAAFRDSIPYPRHIVWGGMTCHEQEIKSDAGARIHEHVKRMFAKLRPFHRFVFSSACNTSTNTPWDNIRYFQDACYAYGRN